MGKEVHMENKDFKVIESQEQLDSIIQDRLSRAEKQYAKQFDGWTSPEDVKTLKESHTAEINKLNELHAQEMEKYKDIDTQLAEKDAKIHAYEISSVKSNVAREIGLPFEAIEFLQGDNEKDIRENAEKLKTMTSNSVGHYTQIAPTRTLEQAKGSSLDEAYKEVLEQFKANN